MKRKPNIIELVGFRVLQKLYEEIKSMARAAISYYSINNKKRR